MATEDATRQKNVKDSRDQTHQSILRKQQRQRAAQQTATPSDEPEDWAPYTLAYKNKIDLEDWLAKNERKMQAQIVEEKKSALAASKIDCSLGERILFSQPMPVHIRYAQGNLRNVNHMLQY